MSRRFEEAMDDLSAPFYLGASSMPVEMMTDDSLMSADLSSLNNSPLPRITKTNASATKICLVCGDRALGYNFNAISCESCKAFFRRNAYKFSSKLCEVDDSRPMDSVRYRVQLFCSKTINGRCKGDCEVTVESRSYCKRCRLQKCFSVGMKRDLILRKYNIISNPTKTASYRIHTKQAATKEPTKNDQQKQYRSRKITENRIKRSGSSSGMSVDSPEQFLDASTTTQDSEPGAETPVTHTIASEIDNSRLEKLDLMSRTMIEEVMGAFHLTFDKPMERNVIDAPSDVEFLNMADTSVRRLVKMAKQLKFFRGLHQEDQISLLKGAVVEVLILRSSKMFSSGSLDWKVNKEGKQHTVSATALTHGSPESMSFILQYQRFVRALLVSTRNDNIILMILIVMTLFSPDRGGWESVGVISAAQEAYANILQSYITINYPDQPLMIARLIQRLADIRDMNEKHTAMLMNMQLDKLEPLITEIFDL